MPWLSQQIKQGCAASAEQSWDRQPPMQGHTLPVIVCELAAFDIWHRDNTTAFVLAIPNGAGNLQHSQDSSVPAQGKKTLRALPTPVYLTALPDGDTLCIHLPCTNNDPLPQQVQIFPSKAPSLSVHLCEALGNKW